MSLWTLKSWGRALTTHVKDVYNALHGLMGQSFVTPSLTRGLGSREARSNSVDKGASCAEETDSDMGHVMHGVVPGISESMGEPFVCERSLIPMLPGLHACRLWPWLLLKLMTLS